MEGELLGVHNHTILVYSRGGLYFIEQERVKDLKKFFFVRLIERVNRKFFSSYVWISENELCLNFDGKLIVADFNKKKTVTINIPFPMKSLNLFLSRENAIYFSPYMTNRKLKSVPIFKLDLKLNSVNEVARFPDGKINHVHSFYQITKDKILVNVGDQSSSMGVWEIDEKEGTIYPYLLGDHLRCVVCEPIQDNRWITISDLPAGDNYLRVYEGEPHCGVCEVKIPVAGPVIYGKRINNFYYFSVSGEPQKPMLISRWIIRGKKQECSLFRFDIAASKIEKVVYGEKDIFPYALFGLGNFTFIPSSCSEATWLKFNAISLSSVTGKEHVKIDIKEKINVAKTYL
jgi:hypothetical protein